MIKLISMFFSKVNTMGKPRAPDSIQDGMS